MAYNFELAERVSGVLQKKSVSFETKKMMGGICFLVDEKLCVGVADDSLLVRFEPSRHAEILAGTGCKPMEVTGKTFKGYVFIEEEALRSAAELNRWVDLALEFNPRAKRSKKKAS